MHKCHDCGKEGIRPFDNGDGKTRCEQCAVKFYYKGVWLGCFLGGNPPKFQGVTGAS